MDEPYVTSRVLSRDYLVTSPYYVECLKPQGLVDVMHCLLIHTPTHLAEVGIGRNERQGVITGREMEIGQFLLPHLRRAVTISDVLEIRTIERTQMADALDALKCSVILTDERGRILHANRSAQHSLRNDGPIEDVHGVLSTREPAASRELRKAIGLAARDETRIGRTGLAISLSQMNSPPVFAHVLPMTGSDMRAHLQPAAVAAVFVGAGPSERDTAEILAAAYGLTPSETRVLANLLIGRTLGETAADLRIAVTTARSHLDNIFAKTGVSRQTELIRLAAQVAPPTALPAD
ncbi:helix-turn-helix transcriptional regulator [Pseudaminobacter soli (ex Li et al. 2025)]|uniref:HTH luxR-type domain-containing protein n=1 Tax=Pseudaminobacter soli (ex Li et al. 2025) TaxID=1295366 RepID=A0A2P7SNQ8_9HYPH|nr:helix-turn-helix transcriptional regulator [Mesorhizobium soli]PSJ64015.1 hypothetical protein C7I85_02575 [Mesorhizobium soli]